MKKTRSRGRSRTRSNRKNRRMRGGMDPNATPTCGR
jgi:hypothetical protein